MTRAEAERRVVEAACDLIRHPRGAGRLLDLQAAVHALSDTLPADSGWRLIADAPKDGTAILLWGPKIAGQHRNYTVDGLCDEHAIGFWLHGGWKSLEVEDCGSMGGEMTGWMPDWVSLDLVEPSHWMPLPEPPTES